MSEELQTPGSGAASSPRVSHLSYMSYMLRLWAVKGEGDETTWRASVEAPFAQEQRHFPDMQSLFAFLVMVTEQPAQEEAQSADGK